jgi:hypothetical protein
MGRPGNTPGSDLQWKQVVAAVATAAGGAAWVSTVGSGVVALRLRQADLPIEPVVALMSAEHRFAIGAGILVAPLLAGFFGFVIDWTWVRMRYPEARAYERHLEHRRRAHRSRQGWAGGTVLLGAVLVYFVLKPSFETFACETVGGRGRGPRGIRSAPACERGYSGPLRTARRVPDGSRGGWRRRDLRGEPRLADVRRNEDHGP